MAPVIWDIDGRRPAAGGRSADFTGDDDAVVRPVRGKKTPETGGRAILVGTLADLDRLVRSLGLAAAPPLSLFTSRLYVRAAAGADTVSLVGPIVGAPYAAMVLETLFAWGVRQFFFFGWCGAISPAVAIGDIVVPTAALIDEGTSAHYDAPRLPPALSHPTPAAVDEIRRLLRSHQGRLHAGRVWTTDAIFRETPRKIKGFRDKGALAVDMETSAIFSVARFRGADIAVILVVSDELFSLKWVPGFKTEAFAAGRALASEVIERLCRPRSTRSSSEEPQS